MDNKIISISQVLLNNEQQYEYKTSKRQTSYPVKFKIKTLQYIENREMQNISHWCESLTSYLLASSPLLVGNLITMLRIQSPSFFTEN